tara:strand:- start:2574 stop:2822 length:249 start_codon:yes stop_codon:yes gene_type:complete
MTIQEIKQRTKKNAPHYFSANTLKFFNQRLSDFKVKKLNETEYLIYAPSYWDGRLMGTSMRIFNTITEDLENASFVDTNLLK